MPLWLLLSVSFSRQPLSSLPGLHTATESFSGMFRVSVSHCNDFSSVQPVLSFSIRGILQHLCCILNMRNPCIQKAKGDEVKCFLPNRVQWKWIHWFFYFLFLIARQQQIPSWITCPQCLLWKRSAVKWSCVSLHICLHINRHLTKSLQESPSLITMKL